MRIRRLELSNFRGVRSLSLEFPDEFTCLVGSNGCGKTTTLDAISLCCSSLDFEGIGKQQQDPEEWTPSITPAQRLESFLKKNIRAGTDGFRVVAAFEHDGKWFEVVLTNRGFDKNELISQPWWWAGLSFIARFDSDMVNFQLRHDLWPAFSAAYTAVTGIGVEPEVMVDTDLEEMGQDGRIVTGFYLLKEDGRVLSRYASSGEKKIAKTLSQVVNLEKERLPHVVLVDEIERHIHHKRHLRMLEGIKNVFAGMQVVATTHSTVIIEEYDPRSHLIDVEEKRHAQEKKP